MPYKSDAQRRLFHHLAAQGKIPMAKVREYDVASKGKKLPEYVSRKKAFGGEVEAKSGTHCPACDYPLDSAPVALDAGEGCPRCGYGSAKDVPHKAHGGVIHAMPKSHSGHGGEVMDSTAYRARGGEMRCAHCGSVEFVPMKAMGGEVGLYGDMKELYPSKKDKGAKLDDGKLGFAKAIKHRRK